MSEWADLGAMSKVCVCRATNCGSCHLPGNLIKFNYGDVSFLKLLSDLDITLGIIACKGAEDADDSRIKMSAKKSTEKVKKRRKELKHQRKQYCYTGLAELTL